MAWRLALGGLLLGLAAVGCRSAPDKVVLGLVVLDDETQLGGARLAVDELNAGGGIDGVPVELSVARGLERPEEVLAAARRFAADPSLLAVVGFVRSTPTISAASLYNELGLPQIIAMATSPGLTAIGDWTYRLCPSDDQQAAALASYAVAEWGKRRLVVLHANDDYGRGLAQLFGRRVQELGGEVAASVMHRDSLHDDDRAHLRRELEVLVPTEIDLVVVFSRWPAALWILETIREVAPGWDVLGGDGLRLAALLEADTGSTEGLRASKFFDPGLPSPRTRRFVDSYRQRFATDPEDLQALTYDAVYLVRDAILGRGFSRRGIKGYLDGLISQATSVEGVAGRYRLGEDHDARRSLHIVEVRDGGFSAVRRTDGT